MTTILDLNADDARTHLLTSSSYCSIPVPNYFDFSEIIDRVSKHIDENAHSLSGKEAIRNLEAVNHVIYANKDGQYAWRPFTIIHPAQYVKIVHTLTEPCNWEFIKSRFLTLRNDSPVECYSIPRPPEQYDSDTEESIMSYWEHFEQRSIELSARYEYIATTDISDCYGSIYTHSIPWALHGKKDAKDNKDSKKYLGNKIDKLFQEMNYGQTNGIPQGNKVSDLIAELILAYADVQLGLATHREAPTNASESWAILRYRDDYRIFTHTRVQAHCLLHKLTTVLQSLNFKLNGNKTRIYGDILTYSIKSDKAALISSNIQLPHQRRSIQKQLIAVRQFALEHPNSGSLKRLLGDFRKHLESARRRDPSYNALTAYPIVLDIALKNPSTYPSCMSIISVFLSDMTPEDRTESVQVIEKRMSSTPNTGILELWLQRLCSPIMSTPREYSETLCKHCPDRDADDILWNTSWLSADLGRIISETPIINRDKYDALQAVFDRSETELFELQYSE